MDEKQNKVETIEDIVAEMRELAADIEAGNAVVGQTVWRNYADRIEAAAKRMEQTYLDQIRDAINQWGHEKYKAEHASVGNAAAMREALENIVKVGYPHNFQHEAPHISGYCYEITDAITKCFEALATPPRNCDRFDSYEQARSEWWKTEVMPRVYGVVSGAEKPFDEWLYAPTTKQKGETDGIK